MFRVKRIEPCIISAEHDVAVPSFTFVPGRVANTLKIGKGLRIVLKRPRSPVLIIIVPPADAIRTPYTLVSS